MQGAGCRGLSGQPEVLGCWGDLMGGHSCLPVSLECRQRTEYIPGGSLVSGDPSGQGRGMSHSQTPLPWELRPPSGPGGSRLGLIRSVEGAELASPPGLRPAAHPLCTCPVSARPQCTHQSSRQLGQATLHGVKARPWALTSSRPYLPLQKNACSSRHINTQ